MSFADMVRVPLLQLMALFAQFLVLGESVDIQYPAFFNFGDSNSDTGGLAAGVAFPLGPPNGQTYFHKPSGRFCDGRLIIDFLSNPSLRSITFIQNRKATCI